MKTITVSLRPDGGLFVHLPGVDDSRLVPVNDLFSLIRILQEDRREALNESGAPTVALVDHWENHEGKNRIDPRCPFCKYLSENKIRRPNNQIKLEDLEIE